MTGRNKIKLTFVMILAFSIILLYCQPEYFYINTDNLKFILYTWDKEIYFKDNSIAKLTDIVVLDFKIYDINGDNNDEILILSADNKNDIYGKYLIIYDTEVADNAIAVNEIFRQDFSELKPWKINTCNLDNDYDCDIFIGVFKDTVFYDDIIKRPFFYSWNGEKLYKKWQGSFFSDWELKDVVFGDYFNLGYDVAAVLEKNNDDYRVSFYSYSGFGFINITRSRNYKNVKSIKTINENNNDKLYLNLYNFKRITVDL